MEDEVQALREGRSLILSPQSSGQHTVQGVAHTQGTMDGETTIPEECDKVALPYR